MSDVSLNSSTSLAPKKGWGAFTGTLWVLLTFIGPQFLVIPLAPLLATITISENAKNFALHGVIELVTLGLLLVIIHQYGLKIADIGLKTWKLRYLGWTLLGLPVYFGLSAAALGLIGTLLPPELMQQEQELGFTAAESPVELALIFIALVIVAPFVEEVIFRGFLLRGYRKLPTVVAVLLVSLLFAVAHMQINVGIDVFVLSLVLCYIRIKTDSLWPAIMLHALKNFIAFYLLFIMGLK